MGAERVLQAAGLIVVGALLAAAPGRALADGAPVPARERIAIVDLGPGPDDAARRTLIEVAVAGGFDALASEGGLGDALAGVAADADAAPLAKAIATAQAAYGAFDCAGAVAAARTAMGIGAARQAAARTDAALPRALVYMMLCADRGGDRDAAQVAATRLRTLGATPAEVPADLWAKYPDVDAVIDRELVTVTIDADVPGADVWVDLRRVGPAPVTVSLTTTDHVIAAAAGSRRGWALGTAVRAQPTVTVPTTAHGSAWEAVAARVAAWRAAGPAAPAAAEIAALLTAVHAHVALVRSGSALVLWGRPGASGAPTVLGGDKLGRGPLADASRLVALAADRAAAWRDHAPDPDQPLLVEPLGGRTFTRADQGPERDEPTKWWVYAAVIGAVVAGGTVLFIENTGQDRQRIEVHVP